MTVNHHTAFVRQYPSTPVSFQPPFKEVTHADLH
jgi:hypothetical protein